MHVTLRETEDRPMTHGLSERIAKIKREFRLTKGVWLNDDQAFAELDRIDAEVQAPELVRRDLSKVEALLKSLNYDRGPIAEALAHIRLTGTAECCGWIEDEDRASVDSLLDDGPDWLNPQWNTGCVNLGLAAEPIAGTF